MMDDKNRCAEYTKPTRFDIGRQCKRRPGRGPGGAYCLQHAKKFEEPPTPIPEGLEPIGRDSQGQEES